MITDFKLFENTQHIDFFKYKSMFSFVDDDYLSMTDDINMYVSPYNISLLMYVVSSIYKSNVDISREGLFLFLKKKPDWNHLDINELDFFAYCPSDYINEIIDTFPKQYDEYIRNKNLKKYKI